MKNTILHLTLAAAALSAPALSHAQSRPLPDGTMVFSPMVGIAFTGGGKTLAEVQYTDGTTEKIRSGGLTHIYLGGELRFVGSPVALQGTVGYHFDTTSADNGDITFSRVPFDFVGMFNLDERFRIGAGLHVDTNVHLTGSGAGASPDLPQKFDNAAGAIVKAEWMAFHEVGLELSYVNVRYKINSAGGVPVTGSSIDGSHVGFGVNYHW